jgi:hypothetical protein
MPHREPTVIFHVGAVPSASWLVQQCLLRNADLWRARRTFGLPNEVLTADLGKGQTVVANPSAFAETLRRTFTDPDIDVVVASRELLGPAFGGPPGSGLHADADAAILALAEATREYRRAIVLSVCPQAQLVEAHFDRALASPRSADPVEWLTSVDLENLSWLPLHRKLTAAFGSEAVHVHDFRRTDAGHVAFLRNVVSAADLVLPSAVADKTPRPKLRLSDTGLRLATAARPHLRSTQERTELLTFLQWNFSELEGPPGTVLSAEQRRALQERYDSEFDLLLARAAVHAEDGAR